MLDCFAIAEKIEARLRSEQDNLSNQYAGSPPIRHFWIEDLLPEEICREIYEAFPSGEGMKQRKSFRELKYVSNQMYEHNPLLEEIVYAFQESGVVDVVKEICEKRTYVRTRNFTRAAYR